MLLQKISPFSYLAKALLAIITISILHLDQSAHAEEWLPLSEEDLTSTSCPSDPDAGAEYLYIKIEADDKNRSARYWQTYRRLKLYNERAVKQMERIPIYYDYSATTLRSIEARVIKPDGTIHTLDKKDIYTQVTKEDKDDEFRKRSFAFPHVDVGDIIEYQFQIRLDPNYYTPENFYRVQQDWPIRKIDIQIRPSQEIWGTKAFKWTSYNCQGKNLEKSGQGFYTMSLENIPGYPEEPHQYSWRAKGAWTLFYHSQSTLTGKKYWNDVAKDLMSKTKSLANQNGAINAKAKELTDGKSETEALNALYDFCRTEIINSRRGDPDALTPEERKKLKDDIAASKTLERGYGRSQDIDILFCALARAAGFDARLAYVENKNKNPFLYSLSSQKVVLPQTVVSVKTGDEWTYCAPGDRYFDFGQLPWQHQGAALLTAEKKSTKLVYSPVTEASVNTTKTDAEFTLDSDGNLNGNFVTVFKGQSNADLQNQLDNLSKQKRIETIKKFIEETWPNSEASNIVIKNASNPLKSINVSCDLYIPSYAEKAGSRLFVNTAVFQKNDLPEFPDKIRKTEVFFPFQETEIDHIKINLPENFQLEAPSAPKPFDVPKVLSYQVKLAYKKSAHQLTYSREKRHFVRTIPVEHYKMIKAFYDQIHKQDQHTITIKAVDESTDLSGENETTTNS